MKHTHIRNGADSGGSEHPNNRSEKLDPSPKSDSHFVREKTNLLRGIANTTDNYLSPEDYAEEQRRLLEQKDFRELMTEISGEKEQCEDDLKQYDRFLNDDPQTGVKLKMAVSGCVIVVCAIMMSFNAARFAVEVTQSMLSALLFTGIFPATAIGLEALVDHFASNRKIIDRTVAYVFLLSFIAFLLNFAHEFAYLPEIGSMEALSGGFDYRLTLISQTLLEMTITFGLISKIKSWASRLAWPLDNPKWLVCKYVLDECVEHLNGVRKQRNDSIAQSAIFTARKDRDEVHSEVASSFFKS